MYQEFLKTYCKVPLQKNCPCADSGQKETALALVVMSRGGPLPMPTPHMVFPHLLSQEAHLLETRAHHEVQEVLLLRPAPGPVSA